MNILVLNGSPRPNGNTAGMIKTFKTEAESAGHTVNTVEVCRKNVETNKHRMTIEIICHTSLIILLIMRTYIPISNPDSEETL